MASQMAHEKDPVVIQLKPIASSILFKISVKIWRKIRLHAAEGREGSNRETL